MFVVMENMFFNKFYICSKKNKEKLEEVGVSNAKMDDALNPRLRQEYMQDVVGRMQNIVFA